MDRAWKETEDLGRKQKKKENKNRWQVGGCGRGRKE